MKILNYKWSFVVVLLTIMVAACDKKDVLKTYSLGHDVTLTATSTTIVPAPADSSRTMVTFSWDDPEYAIDTSQQKFILEIDSTSRNFSKAKSKTVQGIRSISYTGKELNDLLADFGFTPGQQFTFDMRVTSSYQNNNELRRSNVITVKITSYLIPITLVPSSTSALVLQVNNATNQAIAFNWNSSPYGAHNINYALQLAETGTNFASPQVKQLGNLLTTSFTVNDLNSLAIAAGVQGGSTKDVDFRIISYLGAGYTTPLVTSNVVKLNITTFTPIPAALYIVGDATPGGWGNPVPTPSQQFSRLDDVSFGIVVNLTAGKSYLFLPLNGNWDHKYGGTSATGGQLLSDGAVPGSNTPSPAATGDYKIVVNFQTGTYTVTPFTGTIPPNLYIVGDATPGGWNNPVPVPSQQFTKLSAVSYGMVINLTAGASYLFLPVNGDWSHKYGGASATGGTLLADGAVPGSNTPAPAASGLYEIVVNFLTETYSVTPYLGSDPLPGNLYIVGDATPGQWDNPVPVPSQQFDRVGLTEYQIKINLTTGKSYLFLPVNGDWGHKFGGTSAVAGTLLVDNAVPGSNTPAPAVTGDYVINVNFSTMKYTVTKF